MSDLYSASVSTSPPFDLDAAVERSAALGANPNSSRRLLAVHEGPFVEVSCQVREDHPDANSLDELTPGLLHLLLADLIPGLEARMPEKTWKDYLQGRLRPFDGVGFVFAVTNVESDAITINVVCAQSEAPEDGRRVSTAYGPDSERHTKLELPVCVRIYPPAGLAGAFPKNKGGLVQSSVLAFLPIRKSMEPCDIAAIGTSAYAVSKDGGFVLKLGKKPQKVGRPRAEDKKRIATRLIAASKALWIEWEDQTWTRVDPKSGARTDEEPADEARSGPASRKMEIAGSEHDAEPTPDPDTWMLRTDTGTYLVHEPSKAVSYFTGPIERYAWTSGSSATCWSTHMRWVTGTKCNLD